MKVKFLRSIGKQDTIPAQSRPESPEFPTKPGGACYTEGDVAEFKPEVAQKFIDRGLVEVLDEAKK